ncbi:MAG: hypothetical protein RTU92_10470 [Candidatus Thorarchaeota archaeon]
MNKSKYAPLFAVFLVITLILPAIPTNAVDSMPIKSGAAELAMAGPPRLGAIEGLYTNIDQWGGVENVIATAQNVTEYTSADVADLQTIVHNQMANDDGYAWQITFEMSGLSTFPNGVIGGSMATLQVMVRPVVEVPSDLDLADFADLTMNEAIAIANEVAAHYDSELGINLERLLTVPTDTSEYFYYGMGHNMEGKLYQFTYVDMMATSAGETSIDTLLDRMVTLGGFMELAGGADWPSLMTQATEVYMPVHWRASSAPYGYFIGNMLSGFGSSFYRANAVHTDLQETVQGLVIAEVGFVEPGFVQTVVGDEEYSIKQHVGYTGDIESKMATHPSADAVSVIAGSGPQHVTFTGIPADFGFVDDSYEVPMSIPAPWGTMPVNSTFNEILMTYLSEMPKSLALEMTSAFGMITPNMFDSYIDMIWGSTTAAWPDLDAMVRYLGPSDFPDVGDFSVNFDLVSEIMAHAGLNPDTLMGYLNETLADENPLAAIALAFIDFADAYDLFDILQSSTYSHPDTLEAYLNTFIGNVQDMLDEFANHDADTEFADKEAIATFVEDHWDITLQALWNAMAAYSGDTTGVKAAVHDILDADNIESHVIPYLMADLGNSLMTGIGFAAHVNWLDMNSSYIFEALTVDDIVMSFEADPAGLTFDGPFLVVTKSPTERVVQLGTDITFNITVHNYGDAAAYDVKLLDASNPGLDGERDNYWTRATLASGATWVKEYTVTANDAGLFSDMPALCVWFNTTVASYNPADPAAWTGASFYAISAPGYQVYIIDAANPITWLPTPPGGIPAGNWWEGEIFGLPTLYVTAGVGGVAIIGVAILLIRRR